MTSPPQAFRTPRYDSLRVLPAFWVRGHSFARFSLSSLATVLSLRDCELASDLKNYSSNSHSVELPPALQYVSELFKKPDGLVKDAVRFLADYVRTIFVHCFPRVSDENFTTHITPAVTIDYQIDTPPVQRRFCRTISRLRFAGPTL